MNIVFTVSVLILVWVFIAFPIILLFKSLFIAAPHYSSYEPEVSIIVCAYNEEKAIESKLTNIFSLDYPSEKIELIVASDGSTDKTDALATSFLQINRKIRSHLISLPHKGKNQTLNEAIRHASKEIIVFTDVDALFSTDALLHLTKPFQNSGIGAVGGDFRYIKSSKKPSGEQLYWKFDRWLKRLQKRAGSITSHTGQILAIRKCLIGVIPQGVTDDFFISVQAPRDHKTLYFEPAAVAFGYSSDSDRNEFRRKIRIMVAGLKGVWCVKELLNPFKYGFYSIQLFTHKVLRRLLVFPVAAIFLSTLFLYQSNTLIKILLYAQILFHGAAFFYVCTKPKMVIINKMLSIPYYIDMVLYASLVSFVLLLKNSTSYDSWIPDRTDLNKN